MYYIITLKTANHFIDNNLIQVITIISCYSMLSMKYYISAKSLAFCSKIHKLSNISIHF